MMRTLALALTVVTLAQSPSTLAAVAVFTANVERKWPADEREPAVTGEALRLMDAAARAIAEDAKIDSGKIRQAMDGFAAVRKAMDTPARSEDDRTLVVRDALAKGAMVVEAVAVARRREDPKTKTQLGELKRAAEAVDRKKQLRQQGDLLERYFRQAAELMRALQVPDAPATTK